MKRRPREAGRKGNRYAVVTRVGRELDAPTLPTRERRADVVVRDVADGTCQAVYLVGGACGVFRDGETVAVVPASDLDDLVRLRDRLTVLLEEMGRR